MMRPMDICDLIDHVTSLIEPQAGKKDIQVRVSCAVEKAEIDKQKAKTDEKKVQGPYREKGMKSNNKK